MFLSRAVHRATRLEICAPDQLRPFVCSSLSHFNILGQVERLLDNVVGLPSWASAILLPLQFPYVGPLLVLTHHVLLPGVHGMPGLCGW